MHRLSTAFVLAYHGCDRQIGERLLAGEPFKQSENEYDWLGPGIYFWEANPARGLAFAEEVTLRKGATIEEPFVVGAIIELGWCLDLTTSLGITTVADAHQSLVDAADLYNFPLPANSRDLLRRNLDCAVIRRVHKIRKDSGLPPIDTVKGIFIEGDPIYPGAGFYEKTHTQIAVCNPACIKGVFRVSDTQLQPIPHD